MSKQVHEAEPEILTASKVGFRYEEDHPWVLRNINLSISPSEIICLVGVNGSGKTTLGRLLMGELEPTEGQLVLKKGMKTCIRYQNYEKNLLPWYSAQRNVSLLSGNHDEYDLIRLLEIANYNAWQTQRVSKLSGGQKQILSVFTTLSLSFDVLLLDEPFSAIDPTKLVELWQLLRKWSKKNSITLVVITHNLDEAVALGDTVSILMDASTGDLRSFTVDRQNEVGNILDTEAAQTLRKLIMDTFYGIK